MFHTIKRIEFRDTDAAGMAHFSAFFGFMEEAEHAMLRHLGLSVMTPSEQGTISWPRVSATCDYESPVKFEDVMEIEVAVKTIGKKSVTYAIEFRHETRLVASGQLVAVCCLIRPDAPPKSIPIPDEMRRRLSAS